MDRFFGKDEPHSQYENVVCVRTVFDNVQLSVIESILRAEKIPYMLKERGVGSSMKIITGFSLYGTDIFVEKREEERAKEVLYAMLDAEEDIPDESNEEEKRED